MEYSLPVDLEDRFNIDSNLIMETSRYAFETLMWSEGISEGSDLDRSVTSAVWLAVSDFLSNPAVTSIIELTGMDALFVGHNMILSGNRHGAGFWDGAWKDATDQQLKTLHDYSIPIEVYAGDDGVWYAY